MTENLIKTKNELEECLLKGRRLANAVMVQWMPTMAKKLFTEKQIESYKSLYVSREYQVWYSTALVVVKQLLPSRVLDFQSFYEYPGRRSEISLSNYRIGDAIRGCSLQKKNEWGEMIELAGWSTCYQLVDAQCNILESAKSYFETSLHCIQQVLQADLFDSEIDAAKELNKKGFSRAAGAMVGVVLEKHLETVIKAHALTLGKKNPCINDYNQKLKDEGVLDVPTWRFVQRLGDLRNLCDHNKSADPKREDIDELIAGVDKIMKTVA